MLIKYVDLDKLYSYELKRYKLYWIGIIKTDYLLLTYGFFTNENDYKEFIKNEINLDITIVEEYIIRKYTDANLAIKQFKIDWKKAIIKYT